MTPPKLNIPKLSHLKDLFSSTQIIVEHESDFQDDNHLYGISIFKKPVKTTVLFKLSDSTDEKIKKLEAKDGASYRAKIVRFNASMISELYSVSLLLVSNKNQQTLLNIGIIHYSDYHSMLSFADKITENKIINMKEVFK